MHIEVLVEDSSGERLLEILLPQIWGEQGKPHTWRLHSYKGIGRLPQNLAIGVDPAKRALLTQLPRTLNGYGATPGYDAVVVVVDSDDRDCKTFLSELKAVVNACRSVPKTMIRLAVEEIEAWYLGDRSAILAAYPKAKLKALERYVQDSPCGTWELLADAIHPGGAAAIKKAGWPLPGQLKHEWARRIGPHLEFERNQSPSFQKLREGLTRLVAVEAL